MRSHPCAPGALLAAACLVATACTIEVDTAPDRLIIDDSGEGAVRAHLVGSHRADITMTDRELRLHDGTGALVASLRVDPETHLAAGSFAGRTFGDDTAWRDPAPWQTVAASPAGELVRAASAAAARLLDDPAHAASVELATLAGLADMLDQLAGVDAPAVPQDSCTDYWGCYNLYCTGYYYDWYWDSHSDSWQCSWYPMVSCDWCPWI